MKPQRSFQAFVKLVIVVGTASFILCAAQLASTHLNWQFVLLLGLMAALAARLSISIPYVKGEVTVGDTLIFLTMLLYGSAAAVVIATVDGLSSSLYVSKKPRVWLFNSAQMALSTFVTAATVQFFFGPPNQFGRMGYSLTFIGGVSVMFFVQYLTNSGMVATYTAIKTGNGIVETWRTSYLWTSISYLAGAPVAGPAAL